ncbi:unnamed protein product [Oikopleura dioica]|uniref:Uncharacterized protein n=1 Tax=Oikopleura dioica TaxID=34765 RepID=E4Y5Q2_OIKDI|nr:unnamed protein product [Oikopleura dioica]
MDTMKILDIMKPNRRNVSIGGTDYFTVDKNLENYWNAFIDNSFGFTKQEKHLISNRKPRRILDAAEQCQQEGTKLLSPTTLNEKIRKSLEKVEVSWFWMNGFQDNEDKGIIKDIETRKKLTVKDLKGAKIEINWSYHALSPGDILFKSPYKDPYNLQKINFL